jgi:putative ABC transport system permease protein
LLSHEPDVWDRVASGTGVLINEQLARRERLTTGAAITLPGGWQTDIAGIYSDYGNPLAQVIVGLDDLTTRYPGAERDDFGVRLPPSKVDGLKTALIDEFGLPPDNMIDQTALKEFSLAIFDRTFTVTGALNVLTLAVAGFAILTSLLTLSAMRLPQIAPVWALGVSRVEISALELIRAVLLAVLTFVLSVPVGLVLAWILLTVINVDAFGWRIPMLIFPGDWVRLGLLSLLAAVLASLWPASRLARMAPARLVAVFSHER